LIRQPQVLQVRGFRVPVAAGRPTDDEDVIGRWIVVNREFRPAQENAPAEPAVPENRGGAPNATRSEGSSCQSLDFPSGNLYKL
jgi:hypothetical protein